MGSVSDLRDTALGDAQNTRGVPLQEQNQAADLSSGTPNYGFVSCLDSTTKTIIGKRNPTYIHVC